MTLLIEGITPLITQTVLEQCHNINLRTVTDFITYDPEDLAKKIQMSYKDIVSARHSLMERYAAFPQNSESLHYELMESLSILRTGSKKLDLYLNGGIYTGEVTEIHGSAGSGKTQFCLSLISKLLLESKYTVIYLNVNNNFDAKRLEEIMLQCSNNDKTVLQNLHNCKVKTIYNIYEFFDCLDSIKDQLCRKKSIFFNHLKLVIIDSITPLLSPCFGGKCLDGPGIMSNVAQQFKILCVTYMLSILVCNNTVRDSNYSIKPALGSNWKYIPSTSLSISKANSKNYKMSTIKSCRSGLFHQVIFHITEAGICD